MAIQGGVYRQYNERKALSEKLAKQMADEQEAEGGFGSFMSIAAPLAASLILPGVGTALMGGLGGMAGGTGLLSTMLGGAGAAGAGGTGILGALAGTGTGALSTIGGGLMAGGGKALGSYAVGEGMEKIGREAGYGADVDEINLGGGRRAREAQKQGRENLQTSIDSMEEGQRKSALMQGLTAGVDKMGGFDKVKEISSDFGEKIGAGQMPWTSDAEFMEKMANIPETDLIDGQIKPNQLTNIQRITGYDDYVDPMDEFFGEDQAILKGLNLGDSSISGGISSDSISNSLIESSNEWSDESLNAIKGLGIEGLDPSIFESEEEFLRYLASMGGN